MVAAGYAPLESYPGAQARWRCRCLGCGSEVTPRYYNVKNGWGGCRTCGNAVRAASHLIPEDSAVATMRGAGLEPLDPYAGRQKPWRSLCLKCQKVVTPRLDSIIVGNAGCRWCAKRAVDSVAAAQAMAAAGLEPLEPYRGANTPWRCRCSKCDSEVTPTYANVRRGHAGCVRCRHKETAGASTRLTNEAATALMLERGLEPLEPYRNSADQWRCRCLKCGTEVAPRYSNIKQGSGGCQPCKGIAQSARQRGPEAEAIAVMCAAGVEPLEPFRSSRVPWLGQCVVCENRVSPTLSSVKGGQGGCKWCAKKAIDPVAAEAFMRAAGLLPLVDYPGWHSPWLCRCRCGRAVTPRYGSIKRGQGGCHWCGKSVDPAVAIGHMLSAGLEPLAPYRGADAPWPCRCRDCNNVVTPRYKSIREGQGCRFCANYGFRPGDAAFVYLITHATLGAVKVGIGNVDGNRLGQHSKQGWQTVAVVPVPGERAIAIEKTILDWWRVGLGLPPYLSEQEMPQAGWTETVDLDAVDVPTVIHRIQSLATLGKNEGPI